MRRFVMLNQPIVLALGVLLMGELWQSPLDEYRC